MEGHPVWTVAIDVNILFSSFYVFFGEDCPYYVLNRKELYSKVGGTGNVGFLHCIEKMECILVTSKKQILVNLQCFGILYFFFTYLNLLIKELDN
jgi:hypothetical protein